jgi:hypothetical protein
MPEKNYFNSLTQFAVPSLTIGAQVAMALKFPAWGLLINLTAQPFWLYSSWKAYRQAGQIGLFIASVLFTAVTLGGVINYWLL